MIADILRRLVDLGVPADEVVEIAALIEEEIKAGVNERVPARSNGAERTARWRERKRASQCDVTCDVSGDVTDVTTKSPPLVPPHTPPYNPPKTSNPEGARGTRLPDDWQPSSEDLAFAESEGLSPLEVRTEVEKFRDYWHAKPGKDGRKVKWSATFRNWVRNRRPSPSTRSPPEPRGRAANIAVIDEVFDRMQGRQ